MGSRTVSAIVKDTCTAIWEIFQSLEMKPPSSKERWEEIAENYYRRTNFPNCIGSVDGKHIRKLAQNCLNMPEAKPLPNTNDTPLPYVFLGVDAFPLNNNFMEPYPRSNLKTQRRIFNYHLSRSRRTVDCAFGIVSNRWRVFHTSMTIPPDFAVLVTKAACVLHNFVRRRDGYRFEDTLAHYFEDIPFRSPQHRSTNRGRNIRDNFAQYFMTPVGEISYQYKETIINLQQ
nr:unnamed protein product [Callosobruchus analis]